MGLLVDLTPLRVSPDFRRLWTGQAVSSIGTMITSAALPYQVFHETDSSLAVGLLGVVQLVPLLVFAVWGGAIADAFDKRRVLVTVNVVAIAVSGTLAFNATLDDPQVWLMYVLGAAASGTLAASHPAARSLLPMLIEPSLRPAAFALQSTYFSFAMMAGPALGGILIGGLGLGVAYSVDVASFAVALVAFTRLGPAPPAAGAQAASRGSILFGLRFLVRHPVILSIFAVDLVAMVFGMPRALFPALSERLGGGATLYGFLLSAVAAGAFLASVASGWTAHVRRQGLAVLVAIGAWGVAIAVAGLTRNVAAVLVLFAVAGGADMVSAVFRGTIAAEVTPDELRGRVGGIEFAVYAGGPVLGDVEAGVVGGLVSVPFAIVSGGLACVAGAVAFAVLVPSFGRYVRPSSRSDALAVDG